MNGRLFKVKIFATLAALVVLSHEAAALEIRIATIAPDGSGWMQEMREGAAQIDAATDGRVTLKFYPGGTMGDDAQVLRKIRIGQLQGGAFTASGLSGATPALDLYGLPLLFRSSDEVDYVRERLDPILMEKLLSAGFVSFGFVEAGFAQIMSNEPIASVEDLRRQKIWTPDGDSTTALALNALGLSPVPLPVTDVLTGLQTRLVDVVAASPVAALVLQWHTKARYITDLPILYSFGTLVIDARVYERIDEADRVVTQRILSEIVNSLDQSARADNTRALEAMLGRGVESVDVDASNIGVWRSQVEAIYPALRAQSSTDTQFLDRLLETLGEFRSTQASSDP